MKLRSDKDLNKEHEKLPVTLPDDGGSKTANNPIPAVQHDSPKMLTKNHNEEKLVITLFIVKNGLISYHF